MLNSIRRLADRKLRRFLLVGVLNTITGMALMFGFYRLCGLGYWGASALSYFLCSILSYFLNRRYTFGSREGYLRSGLRFTVNIGLCYSLAYLAAKPVLRFCLQIAGGAVSAETLDQLAMLAGMGIFTGLNYLGQRFFVFPDGK